MSFRGTVQGGVIRLVGAVLPDGQVVDVTPVPPVPPPPLPAAGLWADRTDLGETAEASLELRRLAESR
jgi:hypothetical protein